jgi:DNA-binding response OmpR family regulator
MRILYVGNDLALLRFLQVTLEAAVVRCPPSPTACSFIKGINYSLILLDESERGLTGFIRSVEMHKQTPVVMVSNIRFEDIAEAVQGALQELSLEV